MKIPLWYVLTGGPSSGKTTLLEKFKELGYYTVPESARILIDKYVARGMPAREFRRDEMEFQRKVLFMKLDAENRAPKDKIVFFDRGIPDSIAYYKLHNLDTNEVEKVSKNRYKKIFFLEQLPFKKDYARVEDGRTAKKLGELMLKAYKSLGYDVVFVPVIPVDERARFVLARL